MITTSNPLQGVSPRLTESALRLCREGSAKTTSTNGWNATALDEPAPEDALWEEQEASERSYNAWELALPRKHLPHDRKPKRPRSWPVHKETGYRYTYSFDYPETDIGHQNEQRWTSYRHAQRVHMRQIEVFDKLKDDLLERPIVRELGKAEYETIDLNAVSDAAPSDGPAKSCDGQNAASVPNCLPDRHRLVTDAKELTKYMASSAYIVSLGGPPVRELQYGVIIVPYGDEQLFFSQKDDELDQEFGREFGQASVQNSRGSIPEWGYQQTYQSSQPTVSSMDSAMFQFYDRRLQKETWEQDQRDERYRLPGAGQGRLVAKSLGSKGKHNAELPEWPVDTWPSVWKAEPSRVSEGRSREESCVSHAQSKSFFGQRKDGGWGNRDEEPSPDFAHQTSTTGSKSERGSFISRLYRRSRSVAPDSCGRGMRGSPDRHAHSEAGCTKTARCRMSRKRSSSIFRDKAEGDTPSNAHENPGSDAKRHKSRGKALLSFLRGKTGRDDVDAGDTA